MPAALAPPGPAGTTWLILTREARARLVSPWFFAVASLTCLIAWAYGAGFQQTFATESVLVTTDPLMAMNIAVVIFLSLVIGLRLAAAMAWEREHRTLEVLLVGPAGWGSITVAKFAAELAVLVALMLIYAAYLLLAQPLGPGVIGPAEIAGLALLPAFGLPTLALGLLAGALARTVRGAVILFLVLAALLAAVEITRGVLAAAEPDQLSLFSLYLRAGLDAVAPVLSPVSAMAHVARPVEALLTQLPITAATTAGPLALTLATLVLAAFAGRMRGAV